MITAWIVFFTISAGITALTILPLFRPLSSKIKTRTSFHKKIYIDQLEELEREFEQGLIAKEEAETSKTEISRRLLIEDAKERSKASGDEKKTEKFIFGYLAVAVPTAAFGIYLIVGSPHLPALPAAERNPANNWQNIAERNLIILKKKLSNKPNDLQIWRLYAQTLYSLNRYEEAAKAYRQAISLTSDSANLHAALAEALIKSKKGVVSPAASMALANSLEIDPGNFRARYYAGLAAAQTGNLEKAKLTWISLLSESPSDAPWMPSLQKQIDELDSRLILTIPR